MQGIEIPIGAPLGQLDKDLKGASSKLNQFATEASKSAGVLGGAVVKGSNSAAFALTNLGRVAQDAPFGFIGIQNNLNPLLESFQRLKAETGGTGSALKALGSSLIGPAGLGIALSVVSAGVLFYQQYQQRANKEVATAKKVTDEYINSLNQVDQARLKGGQNAQSELTTLKLLYDQYQNAAIPLEKRKDAYKEIQKLYPAYFGNLQFETTATDKTKNAYNGLTESILASARARAAADLITKNSTRQLENEQKVIDLTAQILTEQTKQKKIQLQVESQNLLAKQEANILTSKQRDILNQYLQAGYKENELTKLKNNLLTDTNLLTEKNIQLQKSATAEVLKGGKVSGDIGGKSVSKTTPKFDRTQIKLEGEQVGITLSSGISEGFSNTIPVIGFQVGENLKLGLNDWQTYVNNSLLPKLQTNFETFFNDILMNGKLSFDSLGKAILNTMLSVVASDAARQLTGLFKFNTGSQFTDAKKSGGSGLLGGILGLFGKGAATGGAGAAATGTAATGGALLPILAGVAAIAGIASLFKKKQAAPIPQQFNNVATTGFNAGSDISSGRVVFEISGTNLVGVLNRAGAKLQRFGP
jgi:hypothetical protein